MNLSSETHTPPDSPEPILSLRGVTKRFPGVVALKSVDIDLLPGEIHVLFGENGSGKSTLVNVIAGTYARDEGQFRFNGREIDQWSPQQARAAGISPVFQEFSLVPEMTVEDNLFLGRERGSGWRLNRKEMRDMARQVFAELDFRVNPRARVRTLSRADQQMTEIAKALLQDVRLLILDEPTASLTERETIKLFGLIRRFKEKGVGIVYVSHRMAEIRQISDRITVLRDGERIVTVPSAEVSDLELVEMMTGRQFGMFFPHIAHNPGKTVLSLENVNVPGRLRDISLEVRLGEIVGIAGLVGAGKSAVARAIFGLLPMSSGGIVHRKARITRPTPSGMLRRGVYYLPSDRAAEGLALPRTVRENVSMASLDMPWLSSFNILKLREERRRVMQVVEKLQIRPNRIETQVRYLSGGNQQKILLSRGLTRSSTVFLFDDPTVGIDVGAKKEVYEFMKGLVEQESAILFISSELPELIHLCHRLYVMHAGRIVAEYSGETITEQNVLKSFFQVRDGQGEAGHAG